MNWIKESESELRNFTKIQNDIKTLSDQITSIDYETTSIKCTNFDRERINGGASRREDWIIENIMKKNELELYYAIAKKHMDLVERGLGSVTKEERRILELFYIERPKNYIDILCDELGYEQSNLYYHKDIALRKFTLAVFGVIST